MVAGVRVEVRGLKEALRDLRAVDREFPKTVRRIHKKAGEVVARRARAAADSRTAPAISGRGTNKEAKIQVGLRPPVAIARVIGANRRFGWYQAGRYRHSSGRQFKPHLGNAWQPEDLYQIGHTVSPAMDEVLDVLVDEFTELFSKAFPN